MGTRGREKMKRGSQRLLQMRRVAPLLVVFAVVILSIAGGTWLWRETANAVASQPGKAVSDLGNEHIEPGTESPKPYNSTPPTSGPHHPFLAPWGIHTKEIPDELQVHNLEDGGVIIHYRCDVACPDLIEKLAAAGQPYLSSPHPFVILAPYPKMESRIALTSWGRIDQFDNFEEERIRRFIETYRCTDWHVGPFRGQRRIPKC